MKSAKTPELILKMLSSEFSASSIIFQLNLGPLRVITEYFQAKCFRKT